MGLNALVKIFVKTTDDKVILPEYRHAGDAGMDICSNENIHIKPKQTVCIKTGLCFQIPIGYYIQIVPRSGISLHTPLRISNAPATIDCGYRGEIGIIVTNMSDENFMYTKSYDLKQKGNVSGIYEIKKGDRLAQIVLTKYEFMTFEKATDLSTSERMDNGFGSSGVK